MAHPIASARDAGPWSARQFAARHRIAAVTLRREIAEGRLVAVRVGARRLRIYPEAERAWLAGRTVRPTSHARARLAERLAHEEARS